MGNTDHAVSVDDEGKPLLSDSARAYAAIRQLHLRILPIFLVMATLCYIDRTNTAFASLQMSRDLRFSAETYGGWVWQLPVLLIDSGSAMTKC